MTTSEHTACYGNLFPTREPPTTGEVFQLQPAGPVGIMPRRRAVETDLQAWDNCRACPEVDGCYQLSMAKLLLENAVGSC